MSLSLTGFSYFSASASEKSLPVPDSVDSSQKTQMVGRSTEGETQAKSCCALTSRSGWFEMKGPKDSSSEKRLKDAGLLEDFNHAQANNDGLAVVEFLEKAGLVGAEDGEARTGAVAKRSPYDGMTVNERLFEAGLISQWDESVKINDRHKMISILNSVDLGDLSEGIVDRVLNNKAFYGF